ncbi:MULTISPECIES: hypothetical protein [Leptospira]|uniref:Gluconate 2-dehydrogenase subunit 3 family protein n=1 Tax=Leptospira weilii str. UI 13098 TaxID=1088542 RepID=M6Q7R0_9LEPT|nr:MULTISPECIES: hypothetical protein [Leptospira]EMJ61418.1 hypothetical protein LEP1GSC051_2398 [Leptospira sp. P2653]EMN88693.1 hypothetical protein LEP1GSC108_1335 [Leptospira weilii str. UI 13098]MCL8265129.1 hypothetical protein [Leptospira weilii]MDL5245909.1 hypothetical protein [Leptospira weilii]QDK24446.1 hypothetical protein FHG67_18330 [Leptospira weilii]
MNLWTEKISRRKLFGFGLGGLLSIGVGTFFFRRSKNQSLPKTLFFSISEVEFLSAYSQTLLPQESGFPDIEKAEVIRRLDEEFFFVSPDVSDDFRSLILILEYLPLVKGYWGRFSRLNEEDRKNFLLSQETTESDTIRAALTNLKLPIYLVYYGHESSFKAISYDGPFGNPPEKLSESRIYYKKILGES